VMEWSPGGCGGQATDRKEGAPRVEERAAGEGWGVGVMSADDVDGLWVERSPLVRSTN
jgi:hypothetical protein